MLRELHLRMVGSVCVLVTHRAPGGDPWCHGEADSFHWPPCFSCSFEELQLSQKILRFHSDPGVEGWAGSDVLWQPCAQALEAGVWGPQGSAGDSADLP